jgi:hypothetical protein
MLCVPLCTTVYGRSACGSADRYSGPLVRLVLELQRGAVSCATAGSGGGGGGGGGGPAKLLGVSEVVAAKASQWLRDGGHEALMR